MTPYIFHITLYDAVSVGMLLTGLIFALQLWFAKSAARSANRFLALALIAMALWLTGTIGTVNLLRILPLQFSLAFGPLIYFYVRKTISPEYRLRWNDLVHLSPVLLAQFMWIPGLAPIIKPLAFISAGVYLYLSHRLIKRFYSDLEFNSGDRYRHEWRWLQRLLAGLSAALLLWLPLIAIDYFGFRFTLDTRFYDLLSLLMAAMVIRMAIVVFFKSGTDASAGLPIFARSSPSSGFKQKATWLKKTMEAGRYYQDPELSVNSLAEKLNLNPRELSQLINVALKKNFTDFVNEYRVRDAAQKMQDPAYDHITLLGIAFEAGFNSKSTFNRIFKQMTGKSPVEYKTAVKKEFPTRDLGRPLSYAAIISNHMTTPKWSEEKLNRNYMIRNYLKVAWRNVVRQPFISFVNVFGLAVGLTCCLLILMYIINERSYDKYNANADDIYRVTRIFYDDNGAESLHTGSIAPPFGPLLKTAFPDIKAATRLFAPGTNSLKYKDKLFNETNVFYAEGNLFDFFTIPVVKGDKHSALREPYSVMLTEELAHKYFGDTDPMDKNIRINNNKHEFKVTGIYKPFPSNSHLHPEILMSFSTLRDSAVYGDKFLQTKFNHNAFFTYLLFPKNYNTASVEKQLPSFLDKYVQLPAHASSKKTSQRTSLTFQKLTDIHLRSHLDTELETNGDIKRVYIFSAIALFILLIACINYMNLSTAHSVLRAREIGVRKVMGARRKEIIMQFLSESVLITLVALLIAIACTAAVLPVVNKFSGQALSFTGLFSGPVLLILLLLPFVIGTISGIYPALFMSSFLPVKVLKGILNVGSGSISFRKALVIVQFSISIILIVATTVVYQQLQYVQNTELGFSKEHIITMNMPFDLNAKFNAFRNDLLQNPAIKNAGRSTDVPNDRLIRASGASIIQNGSMQQLKIDLKFINTDYDFLKTYGIPMAAGRGFSRDFKSDSMNYVINEAAVKALGWKDAQNAIGKDIKYGDVQGKVIGVVKDFHFESLHQKIIPLLFAISPFNFYFRFSVKIDGRNTASAIATMMNVWHKYEPETPFEYTFLDEKFGQLYQSDEQQGSLFTIFSGIAIFIACLGLFGLSAFTIGQRTKEIGVRKVLGASISQIVKELSKDFIRLVLIAAIIAFPVAWYFMNQWLNDFAFRITIGWWVFIVAGLAALVIAFVTISFQSIKAALANPVKSLRSE